MRYLTGFWFALLLALTQVTMAGRVGERSPTTYVTIACGAQVSKIKWGYTLKAKSKTAYATYSCNYEPAQGTVLLCFSDLYGEYSSTFNNSVTALQQLCQKNKVTLTEDELFAQYENATQYAITYSEVNGTTYRPFVPNMKAVKLQLKYLRNFYYNWDIPQAFSAILYGFFLLVFILCAFFNYARKLGLQRHMNFKLLTWYRANVTIPALLKERHLDAPVYAKIFSMLVPSRLESLILTLYSFLCIVFLSYGYEISDYTDHFTQRIHNLADRTGVLAFGMFPMMWLFAARNNFLIQFTGLPYSTFVALHKYSSRWMVIYATFHGILFLWLEAMDNNLQNEIKLKYYYWGVIAFGCGIMLCILSIHRLRILAYEAFLYTHITLAVLFVVGVFYHCVTLGYMEWVYCTIAVWAWDRAFRLVRMALFGIRTAEVEIAGEETYKVRVKHGRFFKPFPGSYSFVYFMTSMGFFQSHPFTYTRSGEREITIYIKAKKGITRTVYEKAKLAGGKCTMKVCLEGPYGDHSPSHKYDTALMLAGGNGVPGPYHHTVELAKRESVQQIKLIWAIRDPQSVCWFYDELRALKGTRVQTEVYITGSGGEPLDEELGSMEKSSTSETDSTREKHLYKTDYKACIAELSSHVTFHHNCRPDTDAIILSEFLGANEGDKPRTACVLTCGPPKMCDAARASVARHMMKCKARVDLFEELLVW